MVERVERALLAIGVALGVLALQGCGSSYTATLSNFTQIPDDSTFDLSGGNLHSGIAVGFSPNVNSSDVWGTSTDDDAINLTSSDTNVVGVASVPANSSCSSSQGSQDGNSNGQCGKWIVWAIAPGSATVTITAGGNTVNTIHITVTDPPGQ
jgi:hypothetical protein